MINWENKPDYKTFNGRIIHEVMCPICKFKLTYSDAAKAPEWCYICEQPRAYKEGML